jgi:hypothetical protein
MRCTYGKLQFLCVGIDASVIRTDDTCAVRDTCLGSSQYLINTCGTFIKKIIRNRN